MDVLWIQTCIFAGLYAINGFPTYPSLTVYRAFLSPESTCQQVIAPLIYLLQHTPGGWFLPKAYKVVWTIVWLILPPSIKTHRAWSFVEQPLPVLLNASGKLFERFLAADLGLLQRWVCLSFALCLAFFIFVFTFSVANLVVIWAMGTLCRKSAGLVDMMVQYSLVSPGAIRATKRGLVGLERFTYWVTALTIPISIYLGFLLLFVADDFIQAARELGVKAFA